VNAKSADSRESERHIFAADGKRTTRNGITSLVTENVGGSTRTTTSVEHDSSVSPETL
jgi:hypothetical protein